MTRSKTQREMDENNPRCCSGCFATPVICDWIEHNGVVGLCSFCGSGDRKTVEPVQLEHLFRAAVGLCVPEPTLSGADSDSLKSGMLDPLALHEIFHLRWRTFSPALGTSVRAARLLSQIIGPSHSYKLDDLWVLKTTLPSYNSPIAQWRALCDELKDYHRSNIGADRMNVDARLDTLLSSARLAKRTKSGSFSFYRARIGKHQADQASGETNKSLLGAPPLKLVKVGRANAIDTRVLYAASTATTAVAEVRAHVSEVVSVAKIHPLNQLKLLDLRNRQQRYFVSPVGWTDESALREAFEFAYAFSAIGWQLSLPVQTGEDATAYVPTQYLIEFVASKPFDGVLYDSGLTDGFNVVLFDCDNVEVDQPEIKLVQKIGYTLLSETDYARIVAPKTTDDFERRRSRELREV